MGALQAGKVQMGKKLGAVADLDFLVGPVEGQGLVRRRNETAVLYHTFN